MDEFISKSLKWTNLFQEDELLLVHKVNDFISKSIKWTSSFQEDELFSIKWTSLSVGP